MTRTLALLALLLPLSAGAAPDREAVIEALAGYERPITRDAVTSLGEGWEQALIALATDDAAPSLYRVRALHALRFVDGNGVELVLRATIERHAKAEIGVPVLELAEALDSLSVVDRTGSIGLLGTFLSHPVPDVRRVCAEALARIGSPAAKELLASRLGQEPVEWVRLAIEAGLKSE